MPNNKKTKIMNNEVLLNELTYLGLYNTLSNILPYTSERSAAQYKRMRMYPMCWLGLNFTKLGLSSVPPVFDSEDEEARCITEAVFKPIWGKLIKEALEILDYGWKPFEILWKHDKIYYKKGENVKPYEGLIIDSPKGLDPETVYLLTNEHSGNLAGFKQYGITNDILCEDNKAMIFTHILESGQFYGISALEPAYPYWFDANLNRQFHMRWLERKGVGILKGIYPAGKTDVDGTELDNQDVMLDLLSSVIEGRVLSLPSKRDESGNLVWDVTFLSDEDKTDPFINRAKYLDESILRALIIPEKALTQGEIGARASVEAYQDLFLERKETLLTDIIKVIDEFLVKPFVEYNFGSDTRVHVYAGEFSDRSKEVAGRLVERLVDKDKVKVNTQWLIDKTSIPIEEQEPPEPPEPPEQEPVTPEDEKKIKDEDLNKEEKKELDIEKEKNKAKIKEKEKNSKMSESNARWRLMDRLEKKFNLSMLEDFIDQKSEEFKESLVKEVSSQQERIINYLGKNYTNDDKFITVVKGIEIRKAPIRKLFKSFLFDLNTYIYDIVKSSVESRRYMASSDSVNSFISFRVDLTADKFLTDLESSIKYQLSSDMGSKLSKAQIIEKLKITMDEVLSAHRLSNIASTETGFILGKSFSDYIKDNEKLIKKGLLDPGKRIERVKFSAIMDKDVCPLCRELDGTVVEVNSAIHLKYDTPLHYLCRCVWLPVTKDDILNSEIGGTDLTMGDNGKPLLLDALISMIGKDSKFKTFSEVDTCTHIDETPIKKETKKENKKLEKVVNKLSDKVEGMNKQYDKLSSKLDNQKSPVNNITIPLDINIQKDKQEKRVVKIKRDENGNMTMAEIEGDK